MLILVNILDIDRKPRVRQPVRQRKIREVEVDEEGCEGAKDWLQLVLRV